MAASRRSRANRARSVAALVAGVALWAAAPAAHAEDGGDAKAPDDVWVLEEFDWGDSPELVDESVRYALPFTCNALGARCALPLVTVDGEDLLVKFAFHDGLYRIRILTPDLPRAQADLHAERVWKLLVDYITRHQGPPGKAEASPPDLDDLSTRELHPTHEWVLDDQVIRVGIGRRSEGYFVAATFFDPERAARKLGRATRSAEAPGEASGDGPAGGDGAGR